MERVTGIVAEHAVLHWAARVTARITEVCGIEVKVSTVRCACGIWQGLNLARIVFLDGPDLLRVIRAAIEEERIASQRREIRVGNVDRESALQGGDPCQPPTLEQSALHTTPHRLKDRDF